MRDRTSKNICKYTLFATNFKQNATLFDTNFSCTPTLFATNFRQIVPDKAGHPVPTVEESGGIVPFGRLAGRGGGVVVGLPFE